MAEHALELMRGESDAPTLQPGDRVAWNSRFLGLCAGRVKGVYTKGITAYRDGVGQTKPHFLGRFQPWKIPESIPSLRPRRPQMTDRAPMTDERLAELRKRCSQEMQHAVAEIDRLRAVLTCSDCGSRVDARPGNMICPECLEKAVDELERGRR